MHTSTFVTFNAPPDNTRGKDKRSLSEVRVPNVTKIKRIRMVRVRYVYVMWRKRVRVVRARYVYAGYVSTVDAPMTYADASAFNST